MAKKRTAAASKRTAAAKKTRSGKSLQHARAGRLGGLAPHVCRGSECTKLKKGASAKKKAGAAKKAVKKKVTSLKAKIKKEVTGLKAKVKKDVAGLKAKAKKTVKRKKAAAKKAHRPNRSAGLFRELFEDVYATPAKRRTHAKKSRASRSKKASHHRRGVAKKAVSRSRS